MRLAVSTAIMLLASALTAGPACAMQAFIEALDGSYYTIEVEPTDRVEEVRVKVAEETGIPAEQIALVFADHELLDGSTLQDCGVKRDSVLHVVRRCLTVLVNGMPAAEAQMGQTIALLANWEMNAWSADLMHGAPIPFRRASMWEILPRVAYSGRSRCKAMETSVPPCSRSSLPTACGWSAPTRSPYPSKLPLP